MPELIDIGASPQRRRGKVLEDAILQAAWAELREHGWEDFSMARTAARAGAGKASLYARWPNRAALVAAASRHNAATADRPMELVGDLERDLCAGLEAAAAFLAGEYGEVARGLVADLPKIPVEDRILSNTDPIREATRIAEHARAHGQLGSGEISTRILNLGYHLVSFHFLTHEAPPSTDEIHDIVTTIWLPLLRQAAAAK